MLKTIHAPGWILAENKWEPERNAVWESLFTIANGYLGIRGFPEEGFAAGPSIPAIYAAGIFDPAADGISELARLANFLAVEILLKGEAFKMAEGRVSEFRRELDLRRGVLRRSLLFTSPRGLSTQLEFERFASMDNPHLVSQSITVTPFNWSGEVSVCFRIDLDQPAAGERHLRLLHAEPVARDRLILVAQTIGTRLRVGHACRCNAWVRNAAPPPPQPVFDGLRPGTRFNAALECGQSAAFGRLAATYTSRDPEVDSVERSCLLDIREASQCAQGVQRRRHFQHWTQRWHHADIAIEGPEEDQLALRFAIFHLLQSCPPRDSSVSIAAKGLSGPGYRGHVFWDTEIFMLPFFVATAPASARRLLKYRFNTLDGARRKAAANGYAGAMFPWESTDTGEEACPTQFTDPKTGTPVRILTGKMEQHISADIIYGAYQYVLATRDAAFRDGPFLQMAVETARFWASRASFNAALRRYEISHVIGPDEYHEDVKNNAFTNLMAAWNLRLAADLASRMQHARLERRRKLLTLLEVAGEEIRRWREIAAGLHMPFNRQSGLWKQHENFFSLAEADPGGLSVLKSKLDEAARMAQVNQTRVIKQADVIMLLALFPDSFTQEARQGNWQYYEPRTTHDSSLSPGMHSIVASDLDLRDKAYDYFRRAALVDLHDIMGNTAQGLHCAAMGGTWLAVARGILGIRLDKTEIAVRARLPACWSKISMRVQHRRRWYAIEATPDSVRRERLRYAAQQTAGRNVEAEGSPSAARKSA